MTRRRARTIVIAAVGIFVLIAVGLTRQGVRDMDTSIRVISADGDAQEGGGEVVFDDSSSGRSMRRGSGVSMSGSTSSGGASGSGGDFESGDFGSSGEFAADTGFADSSGGDFASSASPDELSEEVREAEFSADDSADAGSSVSSLPLPPLADSERIIKDGRIEVEVPKGSFDQAFRSVLSLASKVGGQVASSESSRDEDRASGEITIRVPAQRFDQLLESSAGVGKIEHRQVSSQDVSGEFVDLQARVRHLQAQEQFYLGLLGKARVVGDAIAINQHLSGVQGEMERIQGRLRLIEEQTTYSRLTIALYEPGVAPLLTERMLGRPGALGVAWQEALLAFQETIGALLVGIFSMAPLLALALVVWALWRRLRPRTAAQDPRPVAEEEKGPLPVG